jgi:hypothetical protein
MTSNTTGRTQDTRYPELIGPLDAQCTADRDALSRWAVPWTFLVMNLNGVDTPGFHTASFPTAEDRAWLAQLLQDYQRYGEQRAAALTTTDDTADTGESDDVVYLVDPDLTKNELFIALTRGADAAGMGSFVPDNDLSLPDFIGWLWTVTGELSQRVATFQRPVTVWEWQDLSQLCAYGLTLLTDQPTNQPADEAADRSTDQSAP